ncbi:glycosyltransferase family 4 protein [uncultured Vibrio sp.]|uniref:glycosyltransferase family 4 protein n=1 Tax=uncultured Vibrio sp. TaxID=114054 RepID=UPI0025DB538D|nr:glycosyltransferase family 4 protein [uncultured Vibrio sp.]
MMKNKKRDKLRVLYVIQSIYPEKAGAGINLHQFLPFCKGLFDFSVLSTESKITRTDQDKKFNYYRINTQGKSKHYIAITQVSHIFTYLALLFRSDIIHIKSIPKGTFIITLLAKSVGKVVIQEPTLVGHDNSDIFSKYKLGSLLRLAWKISDDRFYISEDVKLNCKEFEGTIVPRGVDLSRFAIKDNTTLRESLGINKEQLVFSQVGRISERKNQLKTLNIVSKLCSKLMIEPVIIFIGPYEKDDYYSNLIKESERLGVNTIFTGQVDNVEDYLSLSKVYIFPSKDEGFGVSILQAMASNNITFISPVGCYKELESEGFNGVIDGNVDEWVSKIEFHLKDINYEVTHNSHIIKNFDLSFISQKTLYLYEKLVKVK